MPEYLFREGRESDLEPMFGIYERRIEWMDRRHIHQWNETYYLEVYPITYYRDHMLSHRLFVMEREGKVCAAVVLLSEDPRWDDAPKRIAYYVHNLVTDFGHPGLGRELLERCESLAAKRGMAYMRLDCAWDNEFLLKYYQDMGYVTAGRCVDGLYVGTRLEKGLQ